MTKQDCDEKELVMIDAQGEWVCELFGCGNALTLHPKEGDQPCLFWRIMQYLLLGNKWKRVSEKE